MVGEVVGGDVMEGGCVCVSGRGRMGVHGVGMVWVRGGAWGKQQGG